MMPDEKTRQKLARAAALIRSADALVVTAGAGMGVDSGLPDFRGDKGLWRAYPALGQLQMGFSSIAKPSNFVKRPQLAWGFYGHRLELYRNTVPHEGFQILLAWGQAMKRSYFVFTSNVDGQFSKAGFEASRVNECHGSLHFLQCINRCTEAIWPADDFVPIVDTVTTELVNETPSCPYCGGMARPNILMFSDSDWLEQRQQEQEARLAEFISQCESPLVIELGAGIAISTVRQFGDYLVKRRNARMIRINPVANRVSDERDVGLQMGALEALRHIQVELGR